MEFVSKDRFRIFIREFDFAGLFNQLGWNYISQSHPLKMDGESFVLRSVAEKSGFRILVCDSESGRIPDYSYRVKINRKITSLFANHLIIYVDRNKTEQIWQYAFKEPSRPVKLTETFWNIKQDPELLFQKASSLFFTLDEEEHITILDVTERVHEGFHQNNERVTKKFYEGFKREHAAFLSFIKGIREKVNSEWYASLMLNRLMFCYFIQKKGFLDNNKNYLKDKLRECRERKSREKFYSFYRNFLLALFHEGLAKPEPRNSLKIEIGKIPYLNGGLFDEHELERNNPGIDIDDEAFERIFTFFDTYEWHLDTRRGATGKEINPDVIGYIFEKYINDRAEMGAYYTKEDITEYIGKYCIIPFLFDEVKQRYPSAFAPDGEIWGTLKQSGDIYLHDAFKKGVNGQLPEEITAGIQAMTRRTGWNKPADASFALPTEIWREVFERRKRYEEVKAKIGSGELHTINDFITYNLDIERFIKDILETTSDPGIIEHFYKALCKITIIDPTCGSGAFLFAALNILEPLYWACIMRMRSFVEDEDRLNLSNKKVFANKYAFFRQVLENIQSPNHNDTQYFIYKTIILRNLYGVDIMNEATEIAKLRLFLKLVANVEVDFHKPNYGIEPLPDIDFNIRTGNTLMGFANEKELEKIFSESIDGALAKEEISRELEIVTRAVERFKTIQLTHGADFDDFKGAKSDLESRHDELNTKLDHLLHKQMEKLDFKKWRRLYQPFHWLSEFNEIIQQRGGFDVVIGNPPYVEYSTIGYKLSGYKTLKCGNLYAFVTERSLNIIRPEGRFGMIVPISSICTDRMVEYQKLILERTSWNSLYAERPSKLFIGAEVQLAITLLAQQEPRKVFSTGYYKWGFEFRDFLFKNLQYVDITREVRKGSFPKIGTEVEKSILHKLTKNKHSINYLKRTGGNYFVSFRNAGGRYYKVVLNFEPDFLINGARQRSSTYQFYYFENALVAESVCAIMNSSLFFWYWLIFSDTWHMVNREIGAFPIDLTNELMDKLAPLNKRLMKDLRRNSVKRKESRNKGKDTVEFIQFNVRESKHIIDEIDRVLALHYQFTNEELDFLVNYDIKYRLGKEPGDETE